MSHVLNTLFCQYNVHVSIRNLHNVIYLLLHMICSWHSHGLDVLADAPNVVTMLGEVPGRKEKNVTFSRSVFFSFTCILLSHDSLGLLRLNFEKVEVYLAESFITVPVEVNSEQQLREVRALLMVPKRCQQLELELRHVRPNLFLHGRQRSPRANKVNLIYNRLHPWLNGLVRHFVVKHSGKIL